jgi:lysophospholipase L1-like esterase
MGLTGCGDVFHANANIAFMGDSITQFWSLPASNLGVAGNDTTQMLARFPAEVSGHSYRAVVILGGTNDVRITTLPIEREVDSAIANIQTMASMAESQNLIVVLCTIPPMTGADDRVQALNAKIAALAEQNHFKLVDYYTPMAGHPEYFKDGIHPNDAGYLVMKTALAGVMPLSY